MVQTCEERQRAVLRVVEEMDVPETRPVGRPRRTWRRTVTQDLKVLKIKKGLAARWGRIIPSPTSTMEEDGL